MDLDKKSDRKRERETERERHRERERSRERRIQSRYRENRKETERFIKKKKPGIWKDDLIYMERVNKNIWFHYPHTKSYLMDRHKKHAHKTHRSISAFGCLVVVSCFFFSCACFLFVSHSISIFCSDQL